MSASHNDTISIPAFNVMAKPAGPTCNLHCKYCFYLEKKNLYPDPAHFKMSPRLLQSFIRQKIQAHRVPVVHFAWQGGEPTLLGVEYFRKIVEFQKQYANGKTITNAFQTNGVLLDDAWCEFFINNDFLVGLSIDGPRQMHDKYRVDKGDKPTFEHVLRGAEYLRKHAVQFNTLTAVHRQNSYKPLELYNFLKSIGSRFLQFIPIVERATPTPGNGSGLVAPDCGDSARVTEWSVKPLQYGNFLCSIFDEWVRKDVAETFVQLFDIALEAWYGMQPSLCIFRKTCGNAMIIEHNGDVYSCDHYVYPEHKLGNIADDPLASLVCSERQRKFGADKLASLPGYCRNCEVRFACNGECPRHRFLKTPDGEKGLNYLCAGYKKYLKHIQEPMSYMVNELKNRKPPANVMNWIKAKDQGSAKSKPGRNGPCPCGSGLKYKKCCGAKT